MTSTNRTLFSDPFLSTLESASEANTQDDPNYYAQTPRELITKSTVQSFVTGTGDVVYNSLMPLLDSTSDELLLVTCFWAQSSTLASINALFRRLSTKAVRRGTTKVRVRICFSSLSLSQKLFHKPSVKGQYYEYSTSYQKLGLPPPDELGGLDLKIKSVFLLPFSVIHPKFIIVDRRTVALPSCNVSWEEWFEGAITMSGPIVKQFLEFYSRFWERKEKLEDRQAEPTMPPTLPAGNEYGTTPAHTFHEFYIMSDGDVPTIFLPSPHRRNPAFRPFTAADKIIAPPTPLNAFTLILIDKAVSRIRIQTPNLTSPPVLSALVRALARGVDVQILTSEKLMVLEQLVTAGTTTSRCIKKLIKRYKELVRQHTGYEALARSDTGAEESVIACAPPGRLRICYFQSVNPSGGGPGVANGEPQQSHLKMTIVDDEVLLLGSGNLDRASWFTSQELGVAFFDAGIARRVGGNVEMALKGRKKLVFDSAREERRSGPRVGVLDF